MNNHVLSLLGLALRGGRLAVGEEPAALAAKSGRARLILLAADAAGNTLRRAEYLAGEGHCLTAVLPFSKAELGGALGRGSAAVAALTDTGLAAAVAERLALQDPERYSELAQRMDLKRRRAKERQSAPHRDPPKKAEEHRPRRPRQESGPDGRGRPYKGSEHRDRPPRDAEHRPSGRNRPRDGERRPDGKGSRPRNGTGHPGGGPHRGGKSGTPRRPK